MPIDISAFRSIAAQSSDRLVYVSGEKLKSAKTQGSRGPEVFKAAVDAFVKAGGALIVLSMQGFGERWHPGEKQERLCAAGRMLYLSPYEPQGAKLDKREMHIRAHALVDWALGHSHDHLEAWP